MNQKRPSPLVKWAGGKSSALAPILASAGTLPGQDGTYFEPFLGGAAAFLAIAPSRAVLSDTNAELIATYEAVRDEPEALMRELDALQPYVVDREYYYAERARAPQAMSRARAAARFIYLNKTCYNGLYRVNRRGQFNVPFGRYTTPPRLYDRENLLAVSAALGAAELVCADYRDALRRANPGDFAYLDPPYHPLSSTANFTGYTPLGFGEGEQRELAREVDRLTQVGVAVLLSNSDTPLIRELYAGYEMTEIEVLRSINSRPDRRKGVGELLISNYGQLQKGLSATGIMQEAAAM